MVINFAPAVVAAAVASAFSDVVAAQMVSSATAKGTSSSMPWGGPTAEPGPKERHTSRRHAARRAQDEPEECVQTAIEVDTSSEDCDCTQCEVFGSTWLSDKCCHPDLKGIYATLLAFEKDSLWLPRLKEFSACTGARVIINYNPEGEDGMEAALRQDVGVTYELADGAILHQEGAGIYDAYVVQGPWLPAVANGLENLSPKIAQNTEALRWLDINAMSRDIVSYNSTVRALPLDVDYVAIGWRQDVFDAHGKRPPETLEELAELSEYFNGKDHNEDGEPDWGFCLTPQVNYLMAFVAPYLQKSTRECRNDNGATVCDGKQTGENMFFDTLTFEPLVQNPGFQRAVELFRRVLMSSNCPEQLRPEGTGPYAIGKCDRRAAFKLGKCAGVISMPGTMTGMLKPWDQGGSNAPRRTNESGSVIWEPEVEDGYWGRRKIFPGTSQVLDASTGKLTECTAKLCPKAVPHPVTGALVNYAPFFAEGGESYAIRGSSSPNRKLLMWELFTWLATLPATALPLSGFYRVSQIQEGSSSAQEMIEDGWPQQMIDDVFELLHVLFMDPERGDGTGALGNGVMDFLVLGFSEYMSDLNRIMLTDFLMSPDQIWAQGTAAQEFPEATYQTAVKDLAAAYNERTASYGRLQQLLRWRETLDMPFLGVQQLCDSLPDFIEEAECLRYAPQETDWTDVVLIPVFIVAACSVATLLGFMVRKIIKDLIKKRELERERMRQYYDSIDYAEEQVNALGYPMSLVQASTFVKMGKLTSFEVLRDRGDLSFLDSLQKAAEFKRDRFIAFLSHQWLGWGIPDPDDVHYNTMRRAVIELVEGVKTNAVSSLGVLSTSQSVRNNRSTGGGMHGGGAHGGGAHGGGAHGGGAHGGGRRSLPMHSSGSGGNRERQVSQSSAGERTRQVSQGSPMSPELSSAASMTTSVAPSELVEPERVFGDAPVTYDSLYVWCDYTSIAQDHRPSQIMAVASLPMYSSIADVFIIIAPPTKHYDSGLPCSIDTYNARGWCRAEMLSKVCGTGLQQMYIMNKHEGSLEKLTEEWLTRLDLTVFNGDFSCCALGHRGSPMCDKQNLIRPVLGLYSLILRQKHRDSAKSMLDYIQRNKAQFFPEKFKFCKHTGECDTRELFGPLAQMMEQHVEECYDFCEVGEPGSNPADVDVEAQDEGKERKADGDTNLTSSGTQEDEHISI